MIGAAGDFGSQTNQEPVFLFCATSPVIRPEDSDATAGEDCPSDDTRGPTGTGDASRGCGTRGSGGTAARAGVPGRVLSREGASMGRRHRYGPRGDYRGHTSDEGPLTKLVYRAIGLAVFGAVALAWVRGCQ